MKKAFISAGVVLVCLFSLTVMGEAGHTGFHLQTGRLLVATDDIRDPRFAESVILILQHDREGTIGLILNNRSELLPEGLPPEISSGLRHIYFGGPVDPYAASVLLFGQPPDGRWKKIVNNVHLTGLAELAELLEEDAAARFRVFLGYAGWAPGQLEMELGHGAWHISPADESILLQENVEQLWKQLQETGPVISL